MTCLRPFVRREEVLSVYGVKHGANQVIRSIVELVLVVFHITLSTYWKQGCGHSSEINIRAGTPHPCHSMRVKETEIRPPSSSLKHLLACLSLLKVINDRISTSLVSDYEQPLAEFESILQQLVPNAVNIVWIALVGLATYAIYRSVARWLSELEARGLLQKSAAFLLRTAFKYVLALLFVAISLSILGIEISLIASLLALAGGTIVGFASVHTIGNLLAGLILMTSKPFQVGDRIHFRGTYADVEEINLIYTRLKTLDNMHIYIPNQMLLSSEITNLSEEVRRGRGVRISCSMTVGYDADPSLVEESLLEAVQGLSWVLEGPKPYIWVTAFQNYAVEFTLYMYTKK